MLMQNFRVTNKKQYGMLWHFLEWSIACKWINRSAQEHVSTDSSLDLWKFQVGGTEGGGEGQRVGGEGRRGGL